MLYCTCCIFYAAPWHLDNTVLRDDESMPLAVWDQYSGQLWCCGKSFPEEQAILFTVWLYFYTYFALKPFYFFEILPLLVPQPYLETKTQTKTLQEATLFNNRPGVGWVCPGRVGKAGGRKSESKAFHKTSFFSVNHCEGGFSHSWRIHFRAAQKKYGMKRHKARDTAPLLQPETQGDGERQR